MADLLPSGGMIIETTELEFTQASVEAVGFSAVSWSWVLTEVDSTPTGAEGRNIRISPSGMSLNVEYFSEEALFPIVTIDYLFDRDNNQRFSVRDFADVPESASDIVKMQADTKSWCDWILNVTASGTDEQGQPASASDSYDIRVYANYTTGRDALLAEVRKRDASSD